MQGTGKPFPGHGSIEADSHIAMPVDERGINDIEMDDLKPFQFLIDSGINALMMAHVIYPRVDKNPAGFSSFWIKQILRKKLGFQGAVFSDDLNMQGAAIAGSYAERARKAFDAGCDMALICNNREGAWEAVKSLQGYSSPASSLRLAHLHGKVFYSRDELIHQPRWKQAKALLEKYVEEPSLNLL